MPRSEPCNPTIAKRAARQARLADLQWFTAFDDAPIVRVRQHIPHSQCASFGKCVENISPSGYLIAVTRNRLLNDSDELVFTQRRVWQ